MRISGSHNDRRRRRWAMEHHTAPAARRRRWWQRILDAFTAWRARAPEPAEPTRIPRPVYGREGAR